MSDEDIRRLVERCKGLSDEQIIAAYHVDYYDQNQPHVRKAFDLMGIAEHEVSAWVYRNIK